MKILNWNECLQERLMIKKKKKFRTATWGNIRQERNPEITSLLSSDTKITVAA